MVLLFDLHVLILTALLLIFYYKTKTRNLKIYQQRKLQQVELWLIQSILGQHPENNVSKYKYY